MKHYKSKCINSLKYFIFIIIYFLYYTRAITYNPFINLTTNFIYCFFIKRKKRAIKNIKLALLIDTGKALKLYKKSLYIEISNFLTFAFLMARLIKNEHIDNISVNNSNILDELMKNNRPKIALSGHIGNFPLMLIALARKGYPVSVIYRESKYFGGNAFKKVLNFYNITAIAYNKSDNMIKHITQSLKKGEFVFFMIDQRGKNCVNVKLFNRDIHVFYGPIVFAKKLDALIVPIFTYYNMEKHIIDVLEPLSLDYNESVIKNTQLMLSYIEYFIIKHPDNWNWAYYNWY